jgi:hypothetical protein
VVLLAPVPLLRVASAPQAAAARQATIPQAFHRVSIGGEHTSRAQAAR